MRTYTFHNYEHGSTVSGGVSFVVCADDDAALREAGRVFEREGLSCVEVCDLRRKVGTVEWDRIGGQLRFSVAP